MMPTTMPTYMICNVSLIVNDVNRLSGMMLWPRISLYHKGVYNPIKIYGSMRLTEANAASSNRWPTMIPSTSVAMISGSAPMVAPMNIGKNVCPFRLACRIIPFAGRYPQTPLRRPRRFPAGGRIGSRRPY